MEFTRLITGPTTGSAGHSYPPPSALYIYSHRLRFYLSLITTKVRLRLSAVKHLLRNLQTQFFFFCNLIV